MLIGILKTRSRTPIYYSLHECVNIQIEFISIDSYTSTLPMLGTFQNRTLAGEENMSGRKILDVNCGGERHVVAQACCRSHLE